MEYNIASDAPVEKKRRKNATGTYVHLELDQCANVKMSVEEQPDDQLYAMKRFFDEIRTTDQLTDVTVICGAIQIPAHKVVLSNRVPFFKDTLAHNTGRKDTIEVSPEEISPDIVKTIIRHAYFVRPLITSQNAQELLEAAAFFRVENLWTRCDKFIAERIVLTMNNCLTVRNYAIGRSAKLLKWKSEEFIGKHLVEISGTDNFKRMPENDMASILNMENIYNLPNEERFWEALVKWIGADVENRKVLTSKLFGFLRISCLSKNCIVKKIAKHPYINSNPAYRQMVRDLLAYKVDPSEEARQKCAEWPLNLQQRPKQMAHLFFIDVCAVANKIHNGIQVKSGLYQRLQVLKGPNTEWVETSWKPIPEGFGTIFEMVVAVKDVVYCVTKREHAFLSYNFGTQTWTIIEEDVGRPRLANLYCVNGKLACYCTDDPNETLVAYYDPATNSWQQVVLKYEPNKPKPNGQNTELIYFCGLTDRDSDGGGKEILCVPEKDKRGARVRLFDAQTGDLIKRGKMTTMASRPRAFGVDEIIVGFASYDRNRKVFVSDDEGLIKVYDVMTDQWRSLPRLNVDRNGFELVVVNDRLHAIGGYRKRNRQLSASVEYMDLTDSNPHWQDGPKLLKNFCPTNDYNFALVYESCP